jgi:hypothetical protein
MDFSNLDSHYPRFFTRFKNMKSEERHKLHQNALAVWLAQTLTTIKPYQNAIIGGVIVVLLAVILTMWWNSESASQANKAWTQFFAAFDQGSTAALANVAENNPRSSAAPVADLASADILLAQGCNMLFTNKATANQSLNKAVELFEKVIEQSGKAALKAQATFGLAKARESQGKLETASKLYNDVKTKWPDTVFAQMAAQRLKDLDRPSIKQVYDQFAKYDPKPVFNSLPDSKPKLDLPDESPIFTPSMTPEQKADDKQESKPEVTKEAVKEEAKNEVTEEKKQDSTDSAPKTPTTDKPDEKAASPTDDQK